MSHGTIIVGGVACVAGAVVVHLATAVRAGVPLTQAAQNIVVNARARVTGDISEQNRLWEQRHHAHVPATVVPATITPYAQASDSWLSTYYAGQTIPDAAHRYPRNDWGQLAGMAEVLSPSVGVEGAEVLCALLSVEGGRSGGGALRQHNVGNFKYSSRDAASPCFHLVDGVNSFDYYPAFASWSDGCRYWLDRLFGQSNYRGALDAARRGDIVGFCGIIGRGGYAASYRDDHYLIPRYIDRVKVRALSGALLRAGKIPGHSWNNGAVR